MIAFDGSLTGLGYRIFRVHKGIEILLHSGTVVLPYDLHGLAKYQNAMELSAVVCALASIANVGVRQTGIHLRGDSMSVLEWTSNSQSTFRSSIARASTMAFSAITGKFDYIITPDWQHLSSEDNWICDDLSRGVNITNDLIGPGGLQQPSSHPFLGIIVDLCNPLQLPQSEYDYSERWHHIDLALSKL